MRELIKKETEERHFTDWYVPRLDMKVTKTTGNSLMFVTNSWKLSSKRLRP